MFSPTCKEKSFLRHVKKKKNHKRKSCYTSCVSFFPLLLIIIHIVRTQTYFQCKLLPDNFNLGLIYLLPFLQNRKKVESN